MRHQSKPTQQLPLSPERAVLGQYISTYGQNQKENVSAHDRPAKQFSFTKLLRRTLALIVLAAVLLGLWLGWQFYDSAVKLTGDRNPLQLASLFLPTSLSESNSRVNILLAGYSSDDPGHQGAQLTDSIMIVSINPQTKSAVLLSIPRDMWVDIPGFGYQKINAAYEDGQQEGFNQPGYDQGGMGLLEEVINQNFGVQTDYYALINYTAFRDAVNSVGGVTVNIQSPDPRGLYDPNTHLMLPNGEVTLNGQQALNLARARGDGAGSYGFPEGDFNRTQHQQQLLIALKAKATSASFLINPLRIAQLANAVGNNIKTDASLGVMETLYRDTRSTNGRSIQSVTLNNYQGQDLLRSYVAPDGEDALIPAAGFNNYSQIQSVIQELLTP